ncbi:MAG: hypothetical protein WCB18_04525 [Thermoplasmata archaeon]
MTPAECPTDALRLTISLFESERDARPNREEFTWEELRAWLTRFDVRDDKSGPAWSPVRYAGGAIRGNAGVESVSVAVMDVDDGSSPEVAHRRLGGLGFEHVIHSTHSSTPEHPKFRVIVPLANPCSAASWPSVFPRLCVLITDGHTDPGTKDPARLFYLPSAKPGGKTFTYSGRGRAVLAADLPPATEATSTPPRGVELGTDGKLPHGRHYEWLRSFIASFVSRTPGATETQAVEAARAAFGVVGDDLSAHEGEIRTLARTALGKFGKPAPPESPHPEPPARNSGTDGAAADVLVEIARARADLFRDEEGELYATVTRDDGRTETHRLRSSGFRRWLGREYYNLRGKAPSAEAMSTARATIEGLAEFDGTVRSVALRVGFADGLLYIDLGDDSRRAVRVSTSGWEIVDSPPVRFVRGKGTAALPLPERGGSLLDLLPFFNATAPTEPHFVLSVAWLVGTFHPTGPYTVLAINGEQGAGKSNATVRSRALTDPANPPHRAAPKDPRDLAVAGRGSRVLAFDNLSTIPDWLSDAICRLSTGGGFATRSLYTDDEEMVFSGKRPVVFNGIVPVAAAGDLRDRALIVTWPSMKSAKTERQLDPAFKKAAPGMFGAILDALVAALAGQEAVAEEYEGPLPRMGDFICWVVAAERALPWPKGTFERVYAENRATGAEVAVSESPVALALLALLRATPTFEGTATALLDRLGIYATPQIQANTKPPVGWPKTPSNLSGDLRRMAPDLRTAGVSVEFPEGSRKKGRLFRIAYRPVESRESPSPASPRPLTIEELGDGVGDGVGDAPVAKAVPLGSSAVDSPQIAPGDGGDGKSRPLSAPPPDVEPELFPPGHETRADRARRHIGGEP